MFLIATRKRSRWRDFWSCSSSQWGWWGKRSRREKGGPDLFRLLADVFLMLPSCWWMGEKKSSHQLFRVALKRCGCGIRCQSWEPEAFKPANINFIYIHVSLPSYQSFYPIETDALLGGFGPLWKKKKKGLWYCNPNPYSWSAKACNSADYHITWKAFRMTVCVHLHCSWQSNNPLYLKHKTAQLHDALHHLTHIAAHGALHSPLKEHL